MQAAIKQVKKVYNKSSKEARDMAKNYVKIVKNQCENEQEMQKKPREMYEKQGAWNYLTIQAGKVARRYERECSKGGKKLAKNMQVKQ